MSETYIPLSQINTCNGCSVHPNHTSDADALARRDSCCVSFRLRAVPRSVDTTSVTEFAFAFCTAPRCE